MKKRSTRRRHNNAGWLRFDLERLEGRCLPSVGAGAGFLAGSDFAPDSSGTSPSAEISTTDLANNLTITAADPAPGAILNSSPGAITLTFDRPIDESSIGYDLTLEQLVPDGSVTSIVLDPGMADPEGTHLVVALNQDLSPGQYRIILSGASQLTGLDGATLGGDGTDRDLADFSIAAPGVTFSDAIDLGTPDSTPTLPSGILDLQANPSDVKLYKFTLPEGQYWRLGAEVTAQRDGGTLDSALALFDGQGQILATDDLGRADDPLDPFLFAGLTAGTYYIGVSGAGNLPDRPGGYDLASGVPGSVLQAQPGGPFTLHLVVDPVEAPISLLDFTVDQADPLDPRPTGFTLGFSGALGFSDRDFLSSLNQMIEVVDQTGTIYPVFAVDYSETDAHLTYLFREHLPEGQYTVRLPREGGLVDLAGLSPVAPDQPAGVLGTFSVGPSGPGDDPHDLGALLPDEAAAGVSRDILLDPGSSITYQFVITSENSYSIPVQYTGGALAIDLVGPDGDVPIDLGVPDPINGTNVPIATLVPGVYHITLSAGGADAIHAHFTLKTLFKLDSIPLNGLGQGPGLSLRYILLTAPGSSPSPLEPPSTDDPIAPPPVVTPPPATTTPPVATTPPAATTPTTTAPPGATTPPTTGAPPTTTAPPTITAPPSATPPPAATPPPVPSSSRESDSAPGTLPPPSSGTGGAPSASLPSLAGPTPSHLEATSGPAPSPSNETGRAPSLSTSPDGTSGSPTSMIAGVMNPPGSSLGLGGDLLGRPSHNGSHGLNHDTETGGGGIAPAIYQNRTPQAIGSGERPSDAHSPEGPTPILVDTIFTAPIDGWMTVSPILERRGGNRLLRFTEEVLGSLDSAINRPIESTPHDDWNTDPDMPRLANDAETAHSIGPDRAQFAPPEMFLPTLLGLIISLIVRFRHRISRWMKLT